MLTAIEGRLPGGRKVASALLALLVVLLVVWTIKSIATQVAALSGILPSISIGARLGSLLPIVLFVGVTGAAAAMLRRMLRRVGEVTVRVTTLGAITPLIALKEEGTALLNVFVPGLSPDGVAAWRQQLSDWEGKLTPSLREAGATEGEIADLKTLVTFQPVHGSPEKGMLAERLHRLRHVIQQLEARARLRTSF